MIVCGCTFGCGLFLFLLSSQVYGELYSAIEDLEILVPTKLELVRQLDTYIQAEETRLTQLRRYKKQTLYISYFFCRRVRHKYFISINCQ